MSCGGNGVNIRFTLLNYDSFTNLKWSQIYVRKCSPPKPSLEPLVAAASLLHTSRTALTETMAEAVTKNSTFTFPFRSPLVKFNDQETY